MGQKFLVVRFSSLGDVLLTTPFLRALKTKFPGADIHYVTKTIYEDILKNNPNISKLILFDDRQGFLGLSRLARRLKGERYDSIIDLHGSVRSRYLAWKLDAPQRMRVEKDTWKRQLLVWTHVDLISKDARPPLQMAERFLRAGARLGLQPDDLRPEMFPSERARKKVEKSCPGTGYIALCPVATWANKRWAFEKFAEAGRMLSEARKTGVLVLGGGRDQELCRKTAARAGGGARSVAGELNLEETAALLSRCSVLITNDTGVMHIAAAMGTPVAAIFGPTTRHWGYFPHAAPEKYRVVERELGCRPCTTNGKAACPLGHHDCMRLITVDDVVRAASAIWSKG